MAALLKEKQVRHLVKIFKKSGFYFGRKEQKMDRNFWEALQLLFFSSKGKDVQRCINAFKAIDPETFKEIPANKNFICQKFKNATLEFLRANLNLREYAEARRLLVYKDCNSTPFRDGKGEAIAFLEEDVIKKHPQLVSQ